MSIQVPWNGMIRITTGEQLARIVAGYLGSQMLCTIHDGGLGQPVELPLPFYLARLWALGNGAVLFAAAGPPAVLFAWTPGAGWAEPRWARVSLH